MLCLNGNEIIFIIVTLKSIHYCYCVFENNDSKYIICIMFTWQYKNPTLESLLFLTKFNQIINVNDVKSVNIALITSSYSDIPHYA